MRTRCCCDFEIAPNVALLGIKAKGEPAEYLVITEPITAEIAAEIDARLSDREVTGYNNLGFDTYLLARLLHGAGPQTLFELSSAIIQAKGLPGWWYVSMAHSQVVLMSLTLCTTPHAADLSNTKRVWG